MEFIDSLYSKLKHLEATSSTNEKLEIVKTFDPGELSAVQLALSRNFYIATLPEHSEGGTQTWTGATSLLLHELSSRAMTGNAAREALAAELSSLKPEHAEVLCRVVLGDLKCGVGVTLVNKAFPGTVFEPPYMRCSLPAKSNLPKWGNAWAEGIISQEKADGMFASLTTNGPGEVTVMSRQGKEFPLDLMQGLRTAEPLLQGFQLHGELLVISKGKVLERQIGNGLLNSLQQGTPLPAGHTLKYLVWDMIPLDANVAGGKCETPYSRRLRQLTGAVEGHAQIAVIPTRTVRSFAEALEHYREVLGQGKEGTIVKHPSGIWKDTTSKDCVKFKLEVDVELEVMGFTPGKGKNASTFGSLEMASSCRELEVNVSGMSDDIRKAIHARGEAAKGMIATVRSNGILKPSDSNPKHTLYLARFVEERKDKRVADTLEQIKEQFQAAMAVAGEVNA